MTLFNRSPFRCRACGKRFYEPRPEPEEIDDETGEQATDQA